MSNDMCLHCRFPICKNPISVIQRVADLSPVPITQYIDNLIENDVCNLVYAITNECGISYDLKYLRYWREILNTYISLYQSSNYKSTTWLRHKDNNDIHIINDKWLYNALNAQGIELVPENSENTIYKLQSQEKFYLDFGFRKAMLNMVEKNIPFESMMCEFGVVTKGGYAKTICENTVLFDERLLCAAKNSTESTELRKELFCVAKKIYSQNLNN